ncbi:MAG TPA: hypothetical protein VH187_10320 [Scandinavium sp.]|jgi:hypothetical protein|uniref:hypothetical protein n=1 Tax=Scandinavium sp. TaxID=2830653 RepID=UPI002E304B38|nr:hypothetical protein [Scandinavium sp.]HEX4501529.1 hypothetical protein [Scandinavium sp.]
MNKTNRAEEKIKEAIKELNKAIITNNIKALSFTSFKQLHKFIETFEISLQKIASGNIPQKNERTLGVAKVVADQWPFNIVLGKVIIDAEQAYKDI